MVPMNERVEVYWNLREKCFSVRQRGRVKLHATDVLLRDAVFVVQHAGRLRVLKERTKNVHAFVRGVLVGYGQGDVPEWAGSGAELAYSKEHVSEAVTYNPYMHDSFVLKGAQHVSIHAAAYAVLNGKHGKASVWARGPRGLMPKNVTESAENGQSE